ncbi:MAG: LamB/YcsF family protein, partial [Verrucomicrobia bacterium]|nr:LamB/YcsF family protein [Verrucomicrobiota bacterium]
RGYRNDGTLVPRGKPGALIESVPEALRRLEKFLTTGEMETVSGGVVKLQAQTLCVHSDSPNAVPLARGAARLLATGR